jgi:hypothetical protein
LDVLVIRKETTLATKVYRKPTHTGRYLSFNSDHLLHVKRGLIQSVHKRASTICQESQDLFNAISSLRYDLQLNGYPRGFIDSVLNSMGTSNSSREVKPLDTVHFLYVKGTSEKFKRIGSRYNIRIIFRTKHILKRPLMKTRPERDLQQRAQCVCSVLCECGETGRPLAMRFCEHRHNLKEGFLEKIKN